MFLVRQRQREEVRVRVRVPEKHANNTKLEEPEKT